MITVQEKMTTGSMISPMGEEPKAKALEGSMVDQCAVTEEEIREADRILKREEELYLEQYALREQERQMRKLILEELSSKEVELSSTLREPDPVISYRGKLVGSEGNLSAVIGEAKSKKSFLCTAIVGDLLSLKASTENGFNSSTCRVLWIDTEQSEIHVRKIARRLTELTGWNRPDKVHPMLKLYALREEAPKDRLNFVRRAIEGWLPKLVVIDGVADLQYNTNDLEESERLIAELMALSTNFKCHILCVLHTNPNTDKARGHVGSSLQRKAETVLYVHRVGESSVVEPQFCRNDAFDRFAFRIEQRIAEGIPQPAALPAESSANSRSDVANLVEELYGGSVERAVLTNKLIDRGFTKNNARVRVSRAIHRGELYFDPMRGVVSTRAMPLDEPPITSGERSSDEVTEEECPF